MELRQKNGIITIKNISQLWGMIGVLVILNEPEPLTYYATAACASVYIACKCLLELEDVN